MKSELDITMSISNTIHNYKYDGAGPHSNQCFLKLWLYLENSKDQLDAANTQNVQLEAEFNQVTSKLNAVSQSLAMALARPASSNPLGGVQQAPKLSKIFADPGTYDSSRGKKFEEWWACIHMWQDENSATLVGVASIHTMLSRMVGGDTHTFAHAWLNEMIGGKKWTWQEFTALVEGNFQSTNKEDWNRKALLSLRQGSNSSPGLTHSRLLPSTQRTG